MALALFTGDYLLLRCAGIVHSKYHFSRLCGRSPGWFTSSVCRQRAIPVAALAALASNLEQRAAATQHWLEAERMRILAHTIRAEMWRRVGARSDAAGAAREQKAEEPRNY